MPQRSPLRVILALGIFTLLLATFFVRVQKKDPGTVQESRKLQNADSGDLSRIASHVRQEGAGVEGVGPNQPVSDVLMFEKITSFQAAERAKADKDPYWLPSNQLIPGAVPPNVHIFWCGQRWFEFKHYLTVQSIIRAMKPDRITIHYVHEPVIDKIFYHQWLDDIKHDFPSLLLEKMTGNTTEFCGEHRETKLRVILETLNVHGGIYVGESTWLLKFPPQNRLVDLDYALEADGEDGYIVLRQGMYDKGLPETLLADGQYKAKASTCGTVSQLYNGNTQASCIVVKGGKFNSFNPMDIWELEDPFGRLSRKIFYGTEQVLRPKPSYDELVPNIGHMIWIGGGRMDFVFYLSALSVLYVVNVDILYIHGDKEPAGDYWPKLKLNDRVKFITRLPPHGIYQGEIEPWYRALMSDIIRVDLMIKYGGIYTDTDAIWVKPLSYEDRGYDAVASFDWIDWSYPFPDSVNFGLSYGKPNAPFWRVFRDSMRVLHNDSPGFTGVQMPYKLLEKYPHLLRIDRHLQVICYKSRCHPTWVNDYHNETKDHITMNSIPNFKEDVNAFHWTHPNPEELKDEETLMKSSGVFADLGKYVLEKAGLLPKS